MNQVDIKVSKSNTSSFRTLVLFVSTQLKANKNLAVWTSSNKSIQNFVKTTDLDNAFHGDFGSTLTFRALSDCDYHNLVLIGLGPASSANHETLRQASATVFKALAANQFYNCEVDTAGLNKVDKNITLVTGAITEGFHLANYACDEFINMTDKKKKPKTFSFNILSHSTTLAKKGVQVGTTLSSAINFSRRLGDIPGNLMTPEILAKTTIAEARGTKLKVTAWDKARIKKEKMGGLLGVSLGSAVDPRFIIMEYKGAAASKKPVCFVGKGLTFDCGGISIKPAAAMDEMKYDMCGGANVIGTMLAIAKLQLKVNAIALVPASENMPGPLANKPGDILVARNGQSVEVLNTDAEGRLILMDALSYASEKKPAVIFDAATLTGAIVMALSNIHTGFFTRNKKLAKKIEEAASTSGELVWGMPITDHHVKDMKGTHADLANISSFRGAGSSTAAAFLEQFVDNKIPWAHFDIAGTAWNTANRLSYSPKKGATGVMIRTFVELAKKF